MKIAVNTTESLVGERNTDHQVSMWTPLFVVYAATQRPATGVFVADTGGQGCWKH